MLQSGLWPSTGSTVEVVFQHLKSRAPFDDPALRGELRNLLNTAPHIEIPLAKLELRPSFPVSALAEPATEQGVADALNWFVAVVREHPDYALPSGPRLSTSASRRRNVIRRLHKRGRRPSDDLVTLSVETSATSEPSQSPSLQSRRSTRRPPPVDRVATPCRACSSSFPECRSMKATSAHRCPSFESSREVEPDIE